MRRLGIVVVSVVWWSVLMGSAEAGVLSSTVTLFQHPLVSLKNAVSYVFEPINCAGQFGTAMLKAHDGAHGELINLVGCVASNMNRDPITLDGPIIPIP